MDKDVRGSTYHHVWVIHYGVDIVCRLNQRKAPMSERDHTGVHTNACRKNRNYLGPIDRKSVV